jgi:hypothetical protein
LAGLGFLNFKKMKTQLKFNDKILFMSEDTWKEEESWRRKKERELHKNMVEFFNKIYNEVNHR